MIDPTPLRTDLPEHVLAAVRTISQPVWGEPYRPGRGPVHYATGPHWPTMLLKLADRWERQAAAARVVAEFMDPADVPDLVAALRASVDAAKARRLASQCVTPGSDANDPAGSAESVTPGDDTSPCG